MQFKWPQPCSFTLAQDWSDPRNSKYYCIIVQYTARLHADKLKVHIQELGGRRFGRQYYNMRLAPEEVGACEF